jgi:hypothetical protein
MRTLPPVRRFLCAAIMAFLAGLGHRDALGGMLVGLNFNDITSASISTTQYQTGNWLVYNATFGGWDRLGFNAAHALQQSGTVQGGAGDYALMIYGDNVATQKTGFAANASGTTYYVSYLMGPTVYTAPGQATQAGDTFRVNLLRVDNSILATNDVAPGAWTGTQTFTQQYFSYVGDGTGPVRMQLLSGNTQTRFVGAIDNVAIWDTVPVPEPSAYTMALAGLACGGFSMWRRRNRTDKICGDSSMFLRNPAAGTNRMSRFIVRGACLAALMFTAAVPAQAGIIYGSGTAGPNTRDSHWRVLISSTATSPPGGQSYPYDAYAYGVVPTNWNGTGGFGVNQVGYTNADGTFYWIGPNPTADSALPFPQEYGYIIGQSFVAEQAGTYNFSFPANGDNLFSFFINGAISTADPNKPTITGGTQIGTTSGDFQTIKILTGTAYLNAGVNWAYAVIDERGFSTGVLVAQSTFTALPEPSTYGMALAGLACGGYSIFRRHKRS